MSVAVRKFFISRFSLDQTNVEWAPSPVEEWKYRLDEQWQETVPDFRRRWISGGTLNYPDRPRTISEERYPDEKFPQMVINSLHLVCKLFSLQMHSFRLTKKLFNYFPELNLNKYRRFSFPNNYLSETAARMSYYSHRLREFCEQKKPVVLEIGAGFGALCRYLQGCYSQYLIVDLHLNLVLASQYLEEAGISHGTIQNYPNKNISVFLLTGEDLKSIDECNIVINTMSMQHMTRTNLDYYFAEIKRLQPDYMYLVNRNIKRDSSDVEIQHYPIPKGYTTVSSNNIYSSDYCEVIFEKEKGNK